MSGHTPGPWEAKKGAGWIVTRPDATRRREAALAVGMTPATTLVGNPHEDHWYDDSESKANALLMAAAPDLLAALKAMADDNEKVARDSFCMCDSDLDTDWAIADPDGFKAWKAAKAAIEKSEGAHE